MKRVLLLLLFGMLACGCSFFNYVKTEDVLKYLNEKYGEENEFYFVKESECNLFELGICSSVFSSKKLYGKEFLVSWKDDKGKTMTDTYLDALYKGSLDSYYADFFRNKLDFSFTVDVKTYGQKDFSGTVSFDEYAKSTKVILSIVPNDYISRSSSEYFHLSTSDSSVDNEKLKKASEEIEKYVTSKYDFNKMTKTVNDIIKDNNLTNVEDVAFYLNSCSTSDYMVTCSYTKSIYKK